MWFFKYFVILCLINASFGIFPGLDELSLLVEKEKFVLPDLKAFVEGLNNEYVSKKLQDWENSHEFFENGFKSSQINFLSAFSLIKRHSIDLKIMRNQLPEESRKTFDNITSQIIQLSDMDLTDAVENILHLQSAYKIQTLDLIQGIINGEKTSPDLTTHELFVIGKEAAKMKDKDFFAQEYLHLVWDKINLGQFNEKEVDERFLMLTLVSSYNRTGQFEKAINAVDFLVNKYAEFKRLVYVKKVLEEQKETFGTSLMNLVNPFDENFEKDGRFSVEKEEIIFRQACRGLERSNKEDVRLQCGLVYLYKNPFTRLAQFKVEEVNMNPYVVIFHDVLSDKEIEHLKIISKSKVQRSAKALKSAWLSNEIEDETVTKISQRIEDMTGLAQEAAEDLRVESYGIGGKEEAHYDHKDEKQVEIGEKRVATLMFYLSDVSKGGATVFPYIKLKISPKKGSAVFWFNLMQSGDGENLMKHAACPVIAGDKWIATKWIRERGQEFRRPCFPENVEDRENEDHIKDFY